MTEKFQPKNTEQLSVDQFRDISVVRLKDLNAAIQNSDRRVRRFLRATVDD